LPHSVSPWPMGGGGLQSCRSQHAKLCPGVGAVAALGLRWHPNFATYPWGVLWVVQARDRGPPRAWRGGGSDFGVDHRRPLPPPPALLRCRCSTILQRPGRKARTVARWVLGDAGCGATRPGLAPAPPSPLLMGPCFVHGRRAQLINNHYSGPAVAEIIRRQLKRITLELLTDQRLVGASFRTKRALALHACCIRTKRA
jgi:hypothetical protein